MNEGMQISGQLVGLTTGTLGRARSNYATARSAEQRAAVTERADTPQTRRAMDRLQRILAADRPLRDDVPGGYYLDISV